MRSLGIIAAAISLWVLACTGESSASSEPALETGIVTNTIPAPGTSITGLAWGGGSLWAVDAETETVFRIDPLMAEVVASFPCDVPSSSYRVTGLAYSGAYDIVMVGLWDYGYNGYVYQYTPLGDYTGSMSMCGG